jgi:hypothetical protein
VISLSARARDAALEAETVALLRALLAEIRALRADLRPRPQVATLSRADRAHLARLLPVIAAGRGSALFTVAELLADDAPGLRIVLTGCSARQLGRLLRRALGLPIGDLMVQSDAVEAHRRLWQIVKVI